MKRSPEWTIVACLLLFAGAVGLDVQINRAGSQPASAEQSASRPPGEAAQTAIIVQASGEYPPTAHEREPPRETLTIPFAAAAIAKRGRFADPSAVRTHLPAEADFLVSVNGLQGVNLRATGLLLKSEDFNDFLDQLSAEAAGSPLARDLTDLYARSAAVANSHVGDALALRLACGMNVCGLAATGVSKAQFEEWFVSFMANPDARHYGVGRHDKILEDGTVEYRLVFSNDPARNASIMPSQ